MAVLEVDLVEPDLRGHVLELEAAEVAVQLARVAEDLLAVVAAAAGQEQVEQPVAVVVEERDARRRATR